MGEEKYLKFDDDKLKWHLLPLKEIEDVVRVLMYGANKYSENNWVGLPRERLEDALMRHVISYLKSEKSDSETGISHLAHAICNCLFLMYFDNKNDK